ncbi:MAG: helix-turn-helix domain-containing protein [Elusimicrobia bacterium]|nr:helix-turn-helix domain-containing protein [Elusimicrobiota bacterium]
MTDHPEQPKTDIGAILRKKRQNRGLSLETVYQHTRIPKHLLEALESNDTHAFSAPVYLRGFLKNYCDYIELDFEPLWRELSGPPGPSAADQRPQLVRPAPKLRAADEESAPLTLPLSDPTLLPFALIVVLLIAGALLWAFKSKGSAPPAPKAPEPPAAVAPVNRVPDMSLKIVPLRETWIRLQVDGALRFEGRMPALAPQEWRAKKGFSLRVSEAQDLNVLLDGATTQVTQFPKDADGGYLIAR